MFQTGEFEVISRNGYSYSSFDEVYEPLLQIIILDEIRIDERVIRLNKQVELNVNFENQMVELSNEEFKLFVTAKNLNVAIKLIGEQFKILYDTYVNDKSRKLSKGALVLREKLKKYFE